MGNAGHPVRVAVGPAVQRAPPPPRLEVKGVEPVVGPAHHNLGGRAGAAAGLGAARGGGDRRGRKRIETRKLSEK